MAAAASLAPVELRLPSEGLNQLVHALDAYGGLISIRRMISELRKCNLFAGDMGTFAAFSEAGYARNLIRETPFYELYCMCWRSGQCSTIHDHGESLCAVRVLQGVMTNVDYAYLRPGFASPGASTLLLPGSTHGSVKRDIHQIGNLQPTQDLMTLHVYSPPLRESTVFRPA